ncbi:MAG: hypothetical protein WCJ45_00465 [bacterium]
MFLAIIALSLIFPVKAETTGNFQIVIDPITKKITVVTNTETIGTGTADASIVNT